MSGKHKRRQRAKEHQTPRRAMRDLDEKGWTASPGWSKQFDAMSRAMADWDARGIPWEEIEGGARLRLPDGTSQDVSWEEVSGEPIAT